jgi:hypothetical protein
VNRILAGLARRGDPFSQPSGSSAFWAYVLAEPHFEPKGADGTSPALLPPARASVVLTIDTNPPLASRRCETSILRDRARPRPRRRNPDPGAQAQG